MGILLTRCYCCVKNWKIHYCTSTLCHWLWRSVCHWLNYWKVKAACCVKCHHKSSCIFDFFFITTTSRILLWKLTWVSRKTIDSNGIFGPPFCCSFKGEKIFDARFVGSYQSVPWDFHQKMNCFSTVSCPRFWAWTPAILAFFKLNQYPEEKEKEGLLSFLGLESILLYSR